MIRGRATVATALALSSLGAALAGCALSPREVAVVTVDERALESEAERPPEPEAPLRRFVLRGGLVRTAAGDVFENGDVLVAGSRIEAVGVDLPLPEGTEVVDVSGTTVTPGLIDTHSHVGVYAAPGLDAHADGNEMVKAVTAYARAEDGFWPQDPQIDRARAGGVTTAQILPGSANLIGGRSFVVKLRPGARSAEDLRFREAPAGLKIACGENPKRVYGEKGGPRTRMGNVAGYRAAFQDAVEYRRKWQRYEEKRERLLAKEREAAEGEEPGEPPDPPAVDDGLETLAGVLDGEVLVHNHCYRADEMSLMLDLAASFGFRIRSFHHAVEAYKIADRLQAAGTAASMWADWWGFKAEAFDGIRENAAMVSAAGARAIIHSDSGVGIQRLNQEVAKAMYAGRRAGFDVSDDEALRWVTANAAWALGVDEWTGTLEPGKLADIAVWRGDFFSVYAIVDRVYIDGALVFGRESGPHPEVDFELGQRPEPVAGASR